MKIINAEALKAELTDLYSDLSKHSSYQSIPGFVADAIGYQVEINEDWRGDRVRLDYILSRLSGNNYRRWGDFGSNTGFFSLNLAHDDPGRHVLAIEANANHADFIRRVASAFELGNLEVIGRPMAIDDLQSIPRQDVLLHLNVLHHAGADFDVGRVNGPDDFLSYAQTYLERLHECTRILVFQLGTNLWGDKSRPIIDYRDDDAKLVLLSQLLVRSGWRIEDVAYATRGVDGLIQYQSVNAAEGLSHLGLSSHVGEFYRRPLYICSTYK